MLLVRGELFDLKKAIYDDECQPRITLIVAQDSFIPENESDVASGNVPPGTVVDTKIVHPFDFEFYLCSHYGSMGTSKPTHYYVLWDENGFTSDDLQELIYGMCFTFVQGAVTENRFASPRSSFSRETSTSSSTDCFEKSFYDLHSDLKNIMFFV